MSRLTAEREHLAQADGHIVAGERRVTAQAYLIAQLSRDGHETSKAETLLLNLQQTLEAWRSHRDGILREIARLEKEQDRS